MNFKTKIVVLMLELCFVLSAQQSAIYQSKAFTIYPNKVIQGSFEANILSAKEMNSN